MKNIKLARYKKLKQRIEKAIKEGRFFHYTRKRQTQLLARLQRYYRQLIKSGQLVAPLTALLLGSNTLSQAQTFTKVTTAASPFILFDIDPNAPFGLTDVGNLVSPTFVDIDGDGDFDAFIGEDDGNTNYFENTSTDSSIPAFNLSTSTAPFGLTNEGFRASPHFVDIDGDGDFDAFIGRLEGNIDYFENTSTDSSIPAFSLSTSTAPFGLTDIGRLSTPNFVDIDGDGDLDAFIGEDDGNINYFENTSTNSSIPAFSLSTSIAPFGLTDVGYKSKPNFVDIDSDGDLDAFVGAEGYYENPINYFKNTSTNSSIPAFSLSTDTAPFGLVELGFYPVISFVDVDEDGDLDAFMGGETGIIKYYINTSTNSSIPAFTTNCTDVGRYAFPSFADIDGDGDLDAFIGEIAGNINYFENTSTDSSISKFILQSTDNAFGLTDIGGAATPSFVDIDRDGDLDAFVGESFGNISYFENTSIDSSIPAFMLQSTNNAFGLKTVDFNAAPHFVDIDGDGDLDAFVGERFGDINYFENTSTDSSIPAFDIPIGNNPFGLTNIGVRSIPFFLDVDEDGDLDAFVGESLGNINYFENTGNSENPAFSLISVNDPFGLSIEDNTSAPAFADLDGDGLFEAIIGDGGGKLTYFESDVATSLVNFWTGNLDTDWNKNENWFPKIVPTTNKEVIIPNVANDPNINSGIDAQAKSLVVETNAILDIFSDGSLLIEGAGGVGFQNNGTFNNAGIIDIRNSEDTGLENNDTFDNTGELFIDKNSSTGVFNGNSFTNTGLIGGEPRNNDFNTSLSGTLSPGYASSSTGGLISFSSSASFNTGTKLVIDVFNHESPTNYDRLNVVEVANLNNLELEVSVNYTPEDGDRVDFINASVFNGNFASTTLPPGWEVFIGPSAYMVYDEDRASCSPDPYGLSGVTTSMLDYITQTEITSTQEIESAAVILYQAATTITLQDGFHAKSGSTFTAKIEDCTVSSSIESPSDEIIEERSSEIENVLRVYPNPFSATTTIQFYLTQTSDVVLSITDINGRIVQQQQYLEAQAGWHHHQLEVSQLPDGMYFLHIRSQEQQVVKQLIVQK